MPQVEELDQTQENWIRQDGADAIAEIEDEKASCGLTTVRSSKTSITNNGIKMIKKS